MASCEETTDRMPGSPASIDMKNVIEPMQCTTAWTSSAPVSSRSVRIAAGQSARATRSASNRVRDAGRSMLPRQSNSHVS